LRLEEAPLLAIGTVDDEGRPWTSLWGGKPGYVRPVGSSVIALSTEVDHKHDPVVTALCRESANNTMFGALTMDLDKRNRWKLCGRAMAGKLQASDGDASALAQLVVQVEQSLGTRSM